MDAKEGFSKKATLKTSSSLATRKVVSFSCDTASARGCAPAGDGSATDGRGLPGRARKGGVLDSFLFHFSFAPRLIQLHRSYVLFLIKAYASRRRRSSPQERGRGGGYIRGGVLMIFQWGERVLSFS